MLNTLLQNVGFAPTETRANRTVYRSPWNTDEQTPSFFVFPNKHWDEKDQLKEFNYKDNSSGLGGDIFHFVMNYYNVTFKDAKSQIESILGYETPTHSTNQNKPVKPESFSLNQQESYKITNIKPLQHVALVNYLKEDRYLKNIDLNKYLNEIHYTIDNKEYFAIGFVNNIGGLEVRNKYFKGSFGKKGFTLLTPSKTKKNLKCFEGFIDFLSYLEITGSEKISDYLILNSVSLLDKALLEVSKDYESIELYYDNDRAGNEATNKTIEALSNAIDKRHFYADCKDINELLIKGI